MLKTVLAKFNGNDLECSNKIHLKGFPFSIDRPKIDGQQGFFLLKSYDESENEDNLVEFIIINHLLLDEGEYNKLTQNEKGGT